MARLIKQQAHPVQRSVLRGQLSSHTVGAAGTGVPGMAPSSKPLNTYFSNLPMTVFSVMTELANKHKSVNLGQGFPDDEGPERMKAIVGEASQQRHNQYPPTGGTLEFA